MYICTLHVWLECQICRAARPHNVIPYLFDTTETPVLTQWNVPQSATLTYDNV